MGRQLHALAGESARLFASLSGEIRLEDVPVAPWADLTALKAGDEDPLEVVVEVPVGKSKRGWNYRPKALQDIVGEVMSQGLAGFLGHQKAENLDTEFPTPVTHWVGAKFDPNAPVTNQAGKVIGKGKAYFRGVVDKAAADLKRWIRAKTVRTVSIFGKAQLQTVAGETDVVGYGPLSIDWTPLGRAGMTTAVVAMGEMDVDEIVGEFDGSHEELREALKNAIAANLGGSGYVWVRSVYDTHCIAEHELNGVSKLYDYSYGLVDGTIQLGQKTEVVEKRVYVPAGEMEDGKGENDNMTWKELIAQLKAKMASGEATLAQVVGEMGLKAQEIAGELDASWLKTVTGASETLDKVREALGVTGEMDVVAVAAEAAKAVTEKRKSDHDALISSVLGEKVAGEMAQALVRRMLQVPADATKEQIAGEVDKILADEAVKGTLSKLHVDQPAGARFSAAPAGDQDGLRTRRVSL